MKRVIQRKAKHSICDGSSELVDSLKKQKRASQDIGNKTRTSAAMLGLALSMGASGSILSCHSKGAMAAETKVQVGVSSVEGSSNDLVEDSSEASLEVESLKGLSEVAHVIREGETLWTISNRYNVSSDSLLHANNFDENSVLRVGQKVIVPLKPSALAPKRVAKEEAVPKVVEQVVVDSLTENLAQLQVESAESLEQNSFDLLSKKVDSQTVVPNQALKQAPSLDDESNVSDGVPLDNAEIPVIQAEVESLALDVEEVGSDAEAAVDADSALVEPVLLSQHVAFSDIEVAEPSAVFDDLNVTVPTTHQIRVGETLADIARRYSISTDQLAEVNRIRNPNRIFAGRVLNLPPGSVLPSVTSVETSPISESLDVDLSVNESDTERVVSLPLESPLENDRLLDTADFATTDSSPVVDGSFYVNRLLGEIEKLSDDYRSVESVEVEERVAVSPAAEEVITEPEQVAYVPGIDSETGSTVAAEQLQVIPDLTNESMTSVSSELKFPVIDDSSTPAQSEPELVASAPLGAENYVPLNQPVTGRMVSPDLPPLTGPENYLPSGSSSFDGYKYPAQGTLTSGYGWRWGRMHRGIDIAAPIGTPIIAAAPGVIEYSGWNSGGYGNMVEVRHPDGSMTRYAHNSRNLVRVGQQVAQGEQIAEMGSTGYSTGPHVHFEIHIPEQGTVNPVAYLSQ